jgi:hypothetical protein
MWECAYPFGPEVTEIGTGMKRHRPEWRTGIRPNPLCSCNPASGEWPLISPEKWGGRLRYAWRSSSQTTMSFGCHEIQGFKHEHRVPR